MGHEGVVRQVSSMHVGMWVCVPDGIAKVSSVPTRCTACSHGCM